MRKAGMTAPPGQAAGREIVVQPVGGVLSIRGMSAAKAGAGGLLGQESATWVICIRPQMPVHRRWSGRAALDHVRMWEDLGAMKTGTCLVRPAGGSGERRACSSVAVPAPAPSGTALGPKRSLEPSLPGKLPNALRA